MNIAERLLDGARWLEDGLPPDVKAPQFLEGDVKLDELDAYCCQVMFEAAAEIDRLERLVQLHEERDAPTLEEANRNQP